MLRALITHGMLLRVDAKHWLWQAVKRFHRALQVDPNYVKAASVACYTWRVGVVGPFTQPSGACSQDKLCRGGIAMRAHGTGVHDAGRRKPWYCTRLHHRWLCHRRRRYGHSICGAYSTAVARPFFASPNHTSKPRDGLFELQMIAIRMAAAAGDSPAGKVHLAQVAAIAHEEVLYACARK